MSEIPTSFSLGGFGTTLRDQGFVPVLGESGTDHFDADDRAISRLHARGLISTAQQVAARQKLGKKVEKAFHKAMAARAALEKPHDPL